MSETCRNGHLLTPELKYVRSSGRVECRQCLRDRDAAWRAANREKINAHRRQPPKVTWMTPERVIRARALWDEGFSASKIAKTIGHGCTKGAISGLRTRHKWPQRKVAAQSYTPSLGYSAEQKAKVQELWGTETSVADIADTINRIGPAQLTAKQVMDLAKRMGLRRPRQFLHKQAQMRGFLRWGKKKPEAQKAPGIPIPLREVYQRAAALHLPRSKWGDINALNNAVRREKPGHPGFVLANYQPSRLTWAS